MSKTLFEITTVGLACVSVLSLLIWGRTPKLACIMLVAALLSLALLAGLYDDQGVTEKISLMLQRAYELFCLEWENIVRMIVNLLMLWGCWIASGYLIHSESSEADCSHAERRYIQGR